MKDKSINMMKTAKEAYRKTIENQDKEMSELIKDIDGSINRAICNKRNYISFDVYAKSTVIIQFKKDLENAGYDVRILDEDYSNKSFMFIEWH